MKDKIEEVLNNDIRPSLAMEGGGIELIDVDEKAGIVKVRLTGGCKGCPMSQLTLIGFVEKTLKNRFPSIKKVVAA